MPTQMQKFEALEASAEELSDIHPYFKAVVYGPSGVGKTVLAAQIAQKITDPEKNILYLDSMEHWVSIQNHPALKNRIRRLRYEGLSQIDTIREAIEKNHGWFANVGTVIFDELDSMQIEDLDLVAMNSTEEKHGPDDVTWPDFNKNTVRVRRTMRAFLKNLDVNILIVAHDGEGKDRRGVTIQRPDFTPKLAKVILEFVHVCGYMTAEVKRGGDGNEYQRLVQVHPTGNLITKCRVGGLPVKLSGDELVKGILEWRKGERAEVDSASSKSLLDNVADDDAIVVDN